MKHYSEFKKEINGIKNVADILKSLEKISASKVKMIKKKITNLDSYTNEILSILNRLSCFYKDKKNKLINKKKSKKKILLIITGEKGLVGSLWQKIIDKIKLIKNEYDELLVVGKKGFERLNDEKIFSKLFFSFDDYSRLEEDINTLNEQILHLYINKNIGYIDILYAYSESISEQKIILQKFLPFIFSQDKNKKQLSLGFPIFISKKEKLFNNLIKKYIKTLFYKIILNSKLSENSSRTVEMEHAKEKSKLTIKNIKKDFLIDRKKKINQAQLEMISTKTKK